MKDKKGGKLHQQGKVSIKKCPLTSVIQNSLRSHSKCFSQWDKGAPRQGMAPIPNNKRNVASWGEEPFRWNVGISCCEAKGERLPLQGWQLRAHTLLQQLREDSGLLKAPLRQEPDPVHSIFQSFSPSFQAGSTQKQQDLCWVFPAPGISLDTGPILTFAPLPLHFFTPCLWRVTPPLFPQTKEGFRVFERNKQTP